MQNKWITACCGPAVTQQLSMLMGGSKPHGHSGAQKPGIAGQLGGLLDTGTETAALLHRSV